MSVTGNNIYSHGEQLVLNCQSDGGPQLEYTWIFSRTEISNNQTLTIDNVTAFNGGDYTCNVINNAGQESDTVTVYSKHVYVKSLNTFSVILHIHPLNMHVCIKW